MLYMTIWHLYIKTFSAEDSVAWAYVPYETFFILKCVMQFLYTIFLVEFKLSFFIKVERWEELNRVEQCEVVTLVLYFKFILFIYFSPKQEHHNYASANISSVCLCVKGLNVVFK